MRMLDRKRKRTRTRMRKRESERYNEFQRAIYLEGTMRIEGQSLKGEDEDARAMWMLVCTEGNNLSGYKNK